MTTLKLGKTNRVVPIRPNRHPTYTAVVFRSPFGTLDRIRIPYEDATTDRISAAVADLALRYSMAEGDSITVEIEK